jgi:tetratricopeptide (TPR) repeat protein
MTTDADWARVRALFEAAVALPGADRAAFLQQLPATDAQARATVEQMLLADARDDGFLVCPLRTADGSTAPSLAGYRVGAFRIVRAIASGGMGTVWEAEQDEPRRKVAIKTMHTGLGDGPARRRFQFEAELLATLRHPAIAQVYGAGVLPGSDGAPSLPWFALEFIEGARPLCRYAREEKLDLVARLRLLRSVCEAVQHAHQRGIIHRDLKAANLLVDGDGHVKVIDFGVARLLAHEAPGTTREGEIVGTLETMSPEQVDGRGHELDVRTDVYALGATLYELATDRAAFAFAGKSLAEAVHAIREEVPPPPTHVARGLPRELDWIVATAMAKDPARRYAGVADFERDLARLLAHQPVLAGPPSRLYRVRKFCARHRLGVSVAAVAACAVLAALAATARAVLARQRADLAEARVASEEHLTQRFAGFLGALFADMSPDVARGKEPTRDAILERGARWVRTELTDRPAVQARLLRSIGHIYSEFGNYATARSLLEESVVLARAQGDAGVRDLIEALTRLGQLYRRLDEGTLAEQALREALAREERAVGSDSIKLGPLLNELGVLLSPTRPDEALALYQRSRDLLLARFGDDNVDAALISNIGSLQVRAHAYRAALHTITRALPVLQANFGNDDARLGVVFDNLAQIHYNLGDYERALEYQQRDLALSERTLTKEHPAIGYSLLTWARIADARGDAAGALTHAERACTLLQRSLPASHQSRIVAQRAYARALLRNGHAEQARATLAGVLASTPEPAGARLARLAALLVAAEIERACGEHARARDLAEQVLADPLLAKDARLCADAHTALAFALAQLHAPADARAAEQRALAVLPSDCKGPARFAQAKLAALLGDAERAEALVREAVAGGCRQRSLLHDPELAAPEFSAVRAAWRCILDR